MKAAEFRPIDQAYFSRVREDGATTQYVGAFSAERHWFLREHRLLGKPTFPSTVYLELARSAFAPIAGGSPFELRDLFFLSPFAVPLGEEKELELLLTKDDDDYEFVFRSRIAAGDEYQEHCRGRLAVAAGAEAPVVDLAALEARCQNSRSENPAFRWDEVKDKLVEVSWHLALGPRWANMRRLMFGDGVELAYQALPEGIGDGEMAETPLHPALLDFTGLLPLKINGTYIPFSFDAIRVYGPLTPAIYTWVVNRDDLMAGKETIRFDATLVDPSGRTLVEIDTMTLKRIDRTHAPDVAAAAPTTAGAYDQPIVRAPDAPASERRSPRRRTSASSWTRRGCSATSCCGRSIGPIRPRGRSRSRWRRPA